MERANTAEFFRPTSPQDIHEQAIAHHLLDANLHHLGDASAGDTRAEHGLHIRHEETPPRAYLRDLLTPMELPLEGLGRHQVRKHASLMFPHLLRIAWLPVLIHIPLRRARNDAHLEQLARNQCSHRRGPKRIARSSPICHEVSDVVAQDEVERKVGVAKKSGNPDASTVLEKNGLTLTRSFPCTTFAEPDAAEPVVARHADSGRLADFAFELSASR
jgi:predicted transcriptional regulator